MKPDAHQGTNAKNGSRGPQMGPGGFFLTNPDLADILGRTDLDFENFHFWYFFASQISRFQISKNLARAGLGRAWALGQGDFFLPIQTLPTFWATWILILRIFISGFIGIPNFQISTSPISKFPEIWLGPNLGPAWAQLGQGLRRLGPALGPP